ncbi:MAG: hypothetical protein ACP5OV_05900 [Acidimicrobiales bacterium]
MRLGRLVAGLGALVYLGLWVLALAREPSLVAPLLLPLVLVGLIWAGLALERAIGIPPRRPKFPPRPKDDP